MKETAHLSHKTFMAAKDRYLCGKLRGTPSCWDSLSGGSDLGELLAYRHKLTDTICLDCLHIHMEELYEKEAKTTHNT
jgi:adenosyl cobinamide kinase/adenosyl cobinamide phosphate guanylyltransferase